MTNNVVFKENCMSRLDLTGKIFYGVRVISYNSTNNQKRSCWNCKCSCGKEFVAVGSELIRGKVKGCGCKWKSINSLYKSRIYRIHHSMKCRCYNESSSSFKRYGARGITVCDEWLGKNGFMNFYNWAMNNGYSDNLSIDRIDNDKGYSPDNCRWATPIEQSNNTSTNVKITYNNMTKTLSEWSRELNINRKTLYKRLSSGWSIERAFTTPVNYNLATKKCNYVKSS